MINQSVTIYLYITSYEAWIETINNKMIQKSWKMDELIKVKCDKKRGKKGNLKRQKQLKQCLSGRI